MTLFILVLWLSLSINDTESRKGYLPRKQRIIDRRLMKAWAAIDRLLIIWKSCYILTFDPAPKNAIPRWCTRRKWHIPMVSNRKRSRGRIKAYDMGQGEGPTVPLQWCTGREWPVNCMTVISAWWRLNIRFQRSSGRSCGRWIII